MIGGGVVAFALLALLGPPRLEPLPGEMWWEEPARAELGQASLWPETRSQAVWARVRLPGRVVLAGEDVATRTVARRSFGAAVSPSTRRMRWFVSWCRTATRVDGFAPRTDDRVELAGAWGAERIGVAGCWRATVRGEREPERVDVYLRWGGGVWDVAIGRHGGGWEAIPRWSSGLRLSINRGTSLCLHNEERSRRLILEWSVPPTAWRCSIDFAAERAGALALAVRWR